MASICSGSSVHPAIPFVCAQLRRLQSGRCRIHPIVQATQQKSPAETVESAKKFLNTLTETFNRPSADFRSESLIQELKDTESLGKRGEAYFVGQFVLIFAVLFPLVDLSVLTRLLGVGALGLGGAIIVAGSSDLGSSLTPLPVPRKDAKLVKDGMFKYMRHPLYTGLFLASSGLAAVTQDSTRLLFAIGLLVLLSFKADYEERELKKTFGFEYEEYAEKVKRFWFL